MNGRHMMFEKLHSVKDQALCLVHRMFTRYQLVQVLQMKIFNMVPHMRNAFNGTIPLVIRIPLVSNPEYTLVLA